MPKNVDINMYLKAKDEASLTFKEVGKLMANIESLQRDLKTSLFGSAKAANELQGNLGKVGSAQQSLEKLAESIIKLGNARDEIKKLGNETNTLTAQLRQLEQESFDAQAAGVDPQAAKNLDKINSKVVQVRETLKTYQKELKELKALQAQGLADGRQIKRMDTLNHKIRESGETYRLLRGEADRLQTKLKQSFGPVPKDLENAIRRVRVQIGSKKKDLNDLNATINRYESELREAGVDTKDLGASIQRLGAAHQQLRQEQTKGNQALTAYSDKSRNAVNSTARLQSRVIGLVSAYVGLYGIVRQVGEVFDAASRVEGIESRFAVSLDGDLTAVANEMAFVREEGERLKLEWVSLGEEYSKFLTSLPPGALKLKEVRQIFTGFSVAARVARLSSEQISGIFVALTQIASKGVISMEELKQQLGDRLPGAVNIFAEAAGFGADEIDKFFKAVEQGKIPAAVMVKAAERIEKKYGGELPAALDSASAAIGNFQNAVTGARLAVADSGFLETLTAALNDVAEKLREDETQKDLIELADSIGLIIKAVVALLPVLDEMAVLFATLTAVRAVKFLSAATEGIIGFHREGQKLNKLMPALIANVKSLAAAYGLITLPQTIQDLAEHFKLTKDNIDIFIRSLDRVALSRRLLTEEFAKPFDDSPFRDLAGKSRDELQKLLKDASNYRSALNQAVAFGGDDQEHVDAARQKSLSLMEILVAITAELNKQESAARNASEAMAKELPLTNGTEQVQAYTAALVELQDLEIDQTINAMNQAFDRNAATLGEARKNTAAYVDNERQRAQALVAIEEFRRQRTLQILAQEAVDKLQLLEKEGKTGEELAQAQREIASELARHRVTETGKYVDTLETELNRAKKLEEEYTKEVKQLYDKLNREISQQNVDTLGSALGGDSPFLALQALEKIREEQKKIADDARKAIDNGNFQEAERLGRRWLEINKSIAEVSITSEKTGIELIRQSESRAQADEQTRRANELIQEAIKGQIREAEKAKTATGEIGKELGNQLDDAKGKLEVALGDEIRINLRLNENELTEELNHIRDQATADPLLMLLKLDAKDAIVRIAELKEPTESVHTVRVKVKYDDQVPGFAQGGAVNLPGFAGGGRISGPGSGTSDSILAALSNGEFVIKASAVRFWGDSFLNSINNHRVPTFRMPTIPRLATGGPVSPTPIKDGFPGTNEKTVTHVIKRENGSVVAEVRGSRSAVDDLINELSGLKQ